MAACRASTSAAYERLGDVLVAQGKLDEALKAAGIASPFVSAWLPPIAAIRSGRMTFNSTDRIRDLSLPSANTNDYTLSGGAITFKSAPMSSSDASWSTLASCIRR
jgi:hypothetical protein